MIAAHQLIFHLITKDRDHQPVSITYMDVNCHHNFITYDRDRQPVSSAYMDVINTTIMTKTCLLADVKENEYMLASRILNQLRLLETQL